MKNKLKDLLKEGEFEASSHYLLSQELEFQLAKSFLTFAMAFIGGIVTLKTALAIEAPMNSSFSLAIGAAVLAAILSFEAQRGIIKDLRVGRAASGLRMYVRIVAPMFCIGTAIGFAIDYFFISVS